MAEDLKNMYDDEFLGILSDKLHAAYKVFDKEKFIHTVIDDTWDELKLKARMMRIAETLGLYLPERYEDALEILFAIDEFCIGFPYLFFPDFVAVYGQADENFELSMKAIERFTIKSSSEFAVRPFIMRDPERMMHQVV